MAKALTLNSKDAFSVKPNLLPELIPDIDRHRNHLTDKSRDLPEVSFQSRADGQTPDSNYS
jgi:hypothetical protein